MTEEKAKSGEKKDTKIIKNNSEILFIYDATMCNPNGDPDDENRPRMDYVTERNLVSDLRLKRYIRDYLMDYKDESLFVCKINGNTVDATGRLRYLYFLSDLISAINDAGELDKLKIDSKVDKILKNKIDGTQTRKEKLIQFVKKLKEDGKSLNDLNNYKELSKLLNLQLSGKTTDLKEITNKEIEKLENKYLLSELVDVRLFGATIPIKNETGGGSSRTFTGPIQFNWGYSLNKVTGVMDSNTITSTFAGAGDEYSTIGKDYRVDYSIIAFHGIISAKRAKHTSLLETDIELFDEAMIKAIPLEATTRSKKGQNPLLYLRIEYNNSEFFFCDLRKYVKIIGANDGELNYSETAKLRSTKDYKLDLSELKTKLEGQKDKIETIYFWKDDDLKIGGFDELKEGGEWKYKDGDNNEERIIKIKKPIKPKDGKQSSKQ